MKTILVADDDKNLRLLVATTLEDPNYTLVQAKDGVDALDKIRSSCPDLVLLDWMMPGMNGLEVLKRLRFDAKTKTIPVILLTAMAQQKHKEQGLQAGANAFLTKPFSPLSLLNTVNDILEANNQTTSTVPLQQ